MKKAIIILLAFVMVLSLAACGDGGDKPPAENTSSGNAYNSSSSRLSQMSESEKENAVQLEAITDALEKLKKDFSFVESETMYKIGSCSCTNKTSKYEEWEVSGTLYLYNKYGSLEEIAYFSYDCIMLNESGGTVSFGHYEITAGKKTYHN